MNTFKKLILATLILGVSSQAINAHPWSTKAIAAATVAGLGLGAASAIKYYGFNTIATAALEKCANAKNWFANKISDALFGSYKKQIAQLREAQTKYLEEIANEHAILKEQIREVITENEAQLHAKEVDRKDAHERAINLTKSIIAQNETLKKLKEEKNRVEEVMRGTIQGLYNRSGQHEAGKKAALTEIERLKTIIASQEKAITELQNTLTQMHVQLAAHATPVNSDEVTSESSIASTDSEEAKVVAHVKEFVQLP